MKFVKGNRAIRDHAKDGKALYLFETRGKGKPVRYLGEFHCVTWGHAESKDRTGEMRQAIYFDLSPLVEVAEETPSEELSIEDLRERAIAAGTTSGKDVAEGKRTYYSRSLTVKEYVLARAAGRCECCGGAAPFQTPKGRPYLEPHHTNMISEGGPDHPRWVAAVCPNCHREIHYGARGDGLNNELHLRIHESEEQHST
jgi:5-methylcytosine-specific restriction protein A